jgi:hypothetical protein
MCELKHSVQTCTPAAYHVIGGEVDDDGLLALHPVEPEIDVNVMVTQAHAKYVRRWGK